MDSRREFIRKAMMLTGAAISFNWRFCSYALTITSCKVFAGSVSVIGCCAQTPAAQNKAKKKPVKVFFIEFCVFTP